MSISIICAAKTVPGTAPGEEEQDERDSRWKTTIAKVDEDGKRKEEELRGRMSERGRGSELRMNG